MRNERKEKGGEGKEGGKVKRSGEI